MNQPTTLHLTASNAKHHLPTLEQKVKQNPKNLALLNGLAHCYQLLNAPQKALACYQKSLKINPKQPVALYSAARLLQDQNASLALEYSYQAQELAPDDKNAHFVYAQQLLASHQLARFKLELDKIKSRWPTDIATYQLNFSYLLKTEEYDQALEQSKKLGKSLKNSPSMLNNLGNILLSTKGPTEALASYRQAIQLMLPKLPKQLVPQLELKEPDAYMDVTQARTALLAIHKTMAELRIPFFLYAGTLLGIYRDGELLPHDKDMDLGLPWNTPRLELLEALMTMGFACPAIEKYRRQVPQHYAVIAHLATGITIDLFFAEPKTIRYTPAAALTPNKEQQKEQQEKKMVVMGFTKNDTTGEGVFAYYTPFAMEKITYAGAEFLIPANTDEHLAEQYGDDWRTPNANYDSMLLCENTAPDARPVGLAMGYNRLTAHLLNNNWKKAHGYCLQIEAVHQDPLITRLRKRLSPLVPDPYPAVAAVKPLYI